MRTVLPPEPSDLDRAWREIRERLIPTPVVATDLAPGALLKLESFQPTGSFKVRGALSALTAVCGDEPVVTASAGNHGLGIAYASQVTGHPATVVVSRNASPAKVAALRRFPVELVQHGESFDEAERHALDLAEQGMRFVSAYNDPHVIAGQATVGYELDVQAEGPLTVVCPVGGGGLAAGLALWGARRGDVRLVAVESHASRAVSASVAAGKVVRTQVGATIADGMSGNIEPGCVTPAILARRVHLTAVSERELMLGLRWLFTSHGLVAEGAGAAAVAALLAGRVPIHGRVVALVTGRNITPAAFAEILP
ncbi:threonine ammonia-lyase [Sphaerisporangium perillae]|uniref:threonine ammonia-lyase n=1 Tax=Sphaerisporangium perillae TaxID=2935860 RepID=UPI00200DEB5F|nr:pyridoxal-phosphate dependent enzyme [Sphaerisporangium perillae]